MAKLTYMTGSLKLKLNQGLDHMTGEDKIITKSFSNVKESASADDMIAVATAISGLQKHDHFETQVAKNYLIDTME